MDMKLPLDRSVRLKQEQDTIQMQTMPDKTWNRDHNHDGSAYLDVRPYFGHSIS